MTFLAHDLPGLSPTGDYAPSFRVEVEGEELDPETCGDVLDLKVTMDLENMTSADITFNNWDDEAVTFKYSDGTRLFVGNRVHVQMGYADRMLSMMRGQINSMSLRYPESGAPTVVVGVLDGMQLLKDRMPREGEMIQYLNLADYQIAQEIAQRNGLTAEVTEIGEVHPEVIQRYQDDAQFLIERAKRIDFDCYIHTYPDRDESVLRFVQPTDDRSDRARQHEFTWGQTMRSFSPVLTLSRQVSEVTVRGWDPRNKAVIVATATSADLPGSGEGTNGPAEAERSLGRRSNVVVDAPVATQQEAQDLAVALLRERAYEFITGSGEIIGLPDMRPGDNVQLNALGKRFSGAYYVKKVEHVINASGYVTRFDVRKVFDGGSEGA